METSQKIHLFTQEVLQFSSKNHLNVLHPYFTPFIVKFLDKCLERVFHHNTYSYSTLIKYPPPPDLFLPENLQWNLNECFQTFQCKSLIEITAYLITFKGAIDKEYEDQRITNCYQELNQIFSSYTTQQQEIAANLEKKIIETLDSFEKTFCEAHAFIKEQIDIVKDVVMNQPNLPLNRSQKPLKTVPFKSNILFGIFRFFTKNW